MVRGKKSGGEPPHSKAAATEERENTGLKCTVPGDPLQSLPGHPLHLGVEFSAWEAENDAVEEDGRGRPTDAICDTRGERQGTDSGVVPRVRDFAADGLFVAAALSGDAERG